MGFSKKRLLELAGIIPERSSPEAIQDLNAYFGDSLFVDNSNSKKPSKKKNKASVSGTADVVDGPYTQVAKKQPFEDDKHKKEFLKKIKAEIFYRRQQKIKSR